MAEDWGSNVSRTLSALQRQFHGVVWAKNRPPLDSELNLMSQMDAEKMRQMVSSAMPSGFITNPNTALSDYDFDQSWSNRFVLGHTYTGEADPVLYANVNGWIIPVCGTRTSSDAQTYNVIALNPPPATQARIDFVFLEAWATLVAPNPATDNKPSASTLWKYGNVEYGGTNIADDLEDPTIGFETTERIQVQYRIRVFGSGTGAGHGSALNVYPDGLDDPSVLGQGTATAPIAGMPYTNMRSALGDPGLWRAGTGDPNNSLGTIDGYTYAIPICALFRRNYSTFVAATLAGNPNHNGSFNRNPYAATLADGRTGATIFVTPTLGTALPRFNAAVPHGNLTITVTNMAGSVLAQGSLLSLTNTYIVVGDEILSMSAINVAGGTVTIGNTDRGRYGTDPTYHAVGATIGIYSNRPDGKFADEIDETDVLDLRKSVTYGEWDYTQLLSSNFAALARGNLRTAYKQALGESQGVTVMEVDYAYTGGVVPNYTEDMDGFDGIRTVFSDAATIQPEVTLVLDNEAALVNQFTATTFIDNIEWDVAPDFVPTGYMNNTDVGTWTNGSVIFLHIGGTNGSQGARRTFKHGEQAVRFVTPYEYWNSDDPEAETDIGGNQAPVKLTFIGHPPHENYTLYEEVPSAITEAEARAKHPGPMYPTQDTTFTKPFIFLGGVVNSDFDSVAVPAASLVNGPPLEVDLGAGFDFNTAGIWWSAGGIRMANDPTAITKPLFHGTKTLYGMLTADGTDFGGNSSNLYIVLWGDIGSRNNNGVFQIIGAGTAAAGYTHWNATNSHSIVVKKIAEDFVAFDATGNTLTAQIRSTLTHTEDGTGLAGTAAACIVLTGIQDTSPWDATTLAVGAPPDYSIQDDSAVRPAIDAKMKLDLTLQYGPGRGGQVRVPDEIARFAAVSPDTTYLRQVPGVLDPSFNGGPLTESFYDSADIQLWNRLGSRGWNAPTATVLGGEVVAGTDIDREHELFVDTGSKTLLFRPYRKRSMTLQLRPMSLTDDGASNVGLLGIYSYATTATLKDNYNLFTTAQRMGYEIPPEYMPRFGRQDIPYYQDISAGAGAFLDGINHLFCDATAVADFNFNIIGGHTNGGAPGVSSMFFCTDQSLTGLFDYCKPATIVAPPPALTHGIYIARKKSQIDVTTLYGPTILSQFNEIVSSDMGADFDGIQLPPYHGIARLYGVYEYGDYVAQGGVTFQADRITPEVGTATNLLKRDATQQTLYIMQNGAMDQTGQTGDHTYIIPKDALDINKIPAIHQTSPHEFDSYEYVVECVVFGFAKNWINDNNYVLARRYTGNGTIVNEAILPAPYDVSASTQIEGVDLILPCPAATAGRFYTAYNRTVYQGDPFMTRDGHNKTRLVSDYENRYGQIANADAISVGTPLDQLDSAGALAVTLPNLRSFEILASFDFYTTMGTGKVAGDLFPGTCLDVSHLEDSTQAATRMPVDASDPEFQVQTRAFTEGQRTNTSRASAVVEFDTTITDPGSTIITSSNINIKGATGAVATFTPMPLATYTPGNQDEFLIATKFWENTGSETIISAVAIPPGASIDLATTITVLGAIPAATADGDMVLVSRDEINPLPTNIVIDGYVSAADTVTVRATNVGNIYEDTFNHDFTGGGLVPDPLLDGTSFTFVTTLAVPPPILFDVGDTVLLSVSETTPMFAGVLLDAWVSGPNDVSVRITNASGAAVGSALLGTCVFNIQIQREAVFGTHNIRAAVFREMYDPYQTAANFAVKVNGHSDLEYQVKARLNGVPSVTLVSEIVGEQGNQAWVAISPVISGGTLNWPWTIDVPHDRDSMAVNYGFAYFAGGEDIPVNAGTGESHYELTGMTERLPLGILANDCDFLCENPLRDSASAFAMWPSTLRPRQENSRLSNDGTPFTSFMGAPGDLLAQSDGAPLHYVGTGSIPAGASCYRVYRGAGGVMVLSGNTPGGLVDWINDSFPAPLMPVLKGGLLAGKAMLVRNYPETAFVANNVTSHGDEVQMLVLTYAVFGDGNSTEDGITIQGEISPTGYGEGYAASDRYRLQGMPLVRRRTRAHLDPNTVDPLLYFP